MAIAFSFPQNQDGPTLAVIGGGIMGAATALAAANANLKTLWFAPAEDPRSDGASARNYALAPESVGFLQGLGIWNALDANSCTVTRMEVFAGQSRIDLAATDAGADFLSVMVLHADLLAALEQAAQFRPNIQRIFARPDSLELSPQMARIHAQGLDHSVQLVIGADGQRSWVRQQAKILWGQRDYGQNGVVAAFESEYPHAGVAAQWFTDQGILALLPLAHSNQLSMVWSTDRVKTIDDGFNQSLAEKITELSQHRYGNLTLLSKAQMSPLKMMLTESQIGERVALLGDAAHTVHPLAGYGLNLGIQDLLCLVGLMKDKPADLGSAVFLNRYDKARRGQVKRIQWALDSLERLVSHPHPTMQRLRAMGLGLASEIGPLRQLLIRQAISPQ